MVATICLNRPAKHNALTPEMLEQLEQILIGLDADRDVRVVLLTAAGNRSFCAGADIKRFKMLEPLDMWAQWTRRGHRVFDHLAGLRQPTIAAVSGNAYGGGFELALACDLRILADDATLGLTEVGIGTLPGWGGTGRLRDLVGAGRAKELIFTGEPLTAERALAWGVANQLAPKAEVITAAHALASRSPSEPRSPYRWPNRRSMPATPTRRWSRSVQRPPPSPRTQSKGSPPSQRNATRATAGPEPVPISTETKAPP